MPSPNSDSRPEYEIRQFNFNNLPDDNELKNFKLTAFRTPNGWEDAFTWIDIYRSFCLFAFEIKPQHLKVFKDLRETVLGRNIIFSKTTDNLNSAFKIGTNFYAEQRLSSVSIVHIISRLIEFCRLPASQFIVRYEVPVTEDASELEPSAELQSAPVPKFPCFTLDNPPILKNIGSKPVSIKFGQRVTNWNDVLEQVVRYIDYYYPECIEEIYDDYGPKGKVRKLILAKSRRSFTNSSSTKEPRIIRQNLYVKADLASDDVIQLAAEFLSYCDIDPSDVLIEYRPKDWVVPELPLSTRSDAKSDEPESDDEDDDNDYEFDNDPASGVSNEEEFDDEEDEDFDDDGVDIGYQFYDNGKPVITPWLQKLIDAIEENYPEGIDLDDPDCIETIELASGERCNEDIIKLLKMTLFENEEGFYYIPKRIADDSTVKSMADFIDNGISQFNAVSLSVIREKFQDQLDYACDVKELADFVEWYVFKEIDRLVAIEFNDTAGDGVCLLESETTDEFCEIFYGQIENYLEKTNSPVPMSQLCQLYPTLNETIISYALSDDRFGCSIQEETKDGQLFYSIRSDSQLNDEATDKSEPASELYSLSFTLDEPIPQLRFTKPIAMTIGDDTIELNLWREVITKAAIYLSKKEPNLFNALIEEYGVRSKNRTLFSHNRSDILQPYQICSDLWVEVKFDANDCVKQTKKFLSFFNISFSQVRIEYLPGDRAGMQNTGANHRSSNVSELLPEAPSLFKRSEEEVSLLCQTILQRAAEMFSQNSCHESQLVELRNTFAEGEFSSDKELLDFITQNHIGVFSGRWVYFLTRAVQDCLGEIYRQLQQEGQIIAYYNLLFDHKLDLFESINVGKDETTISGLFTAMEAQSHYPWGLICYPTPEYLSLKEDGTIKDALLKYFEDNTVLTYEQIESAFPYIPIEVIQEKLKSDNDFISLANGSYTYYDKIYFDKALADKLLKKIESEIQKNEFIPCNDIDIRPALDDNSEMTSRAILEYFCKRILPAKYVRKGNVISDASKPICSAEIIEKLCETKDCVTLDELKSLADDLSASWQTAFTIAFDKMVRVDKDHFVSPSLIQFDVEAIDKVLEDFVNTNDFIPLQDVTNFISFPQYGSFSWNWFLLESYCRKFSKLFGFMVAVPNSQNVGAIVRKSAIFDDYTVLMANAVINYEIDLTEDSVGRFLIGAHYIAIVKQNCIQNVLAKVQLLRGE